MPNSLDPDQARRQVGLDLGPNCLQKLSADETRRFRVNLRKVAIYLRKVKTMISLCKIHMLIVDVFVYIRVEVICFFVFSGFCKH